MEGSIIAVARRLKRAGRRVARAVRRRVTPGAAGPTPPDLVVTLRSRAEWERFRAATPRAADPEEARRIARHAELHGVESPFLGYLPPEAVTVAGTNLRESLHAGGFNPRQRAVLDRFLLLPKAQDLHGIRLYAHEAVTGFGMLLRGRYPFFLGSEYAPDDMAARRLFPVPIIDITRSGLPDATFDAVLSNEVLEHVPDLDAALRDTARILKPGGRLIATFPFDYGAETTSQRAVLEQGGVRHLAEPEYHGNPADPEGGSLVFQIPGWDILERAREAGFRDPRFVFLSSYAKGITSTELSGVLVFEADR